MANVAPAPDTFDASVETLIIGAGAAGMVAALSAAEAGQDALILERDASPSGSTALSAGLIPAAGTRFQSAAGITDKPALFAADIQRKAKNENDDALVRLVAGAAAEAVEWLADRWGLPFSVVTDFDYPGHSRRRMHGLPTRSGRELIDALTAAAASIGIDVVCQATARTLLVRGDRIAGVDLRRPDGRSETIGCERLILACNGFGGDAEKVRTHMPEIAGAVWFGHGGNQGDALDWGAALGASALHLGAYQGHGNVAHPHGILITWATMTEGGVQVNAAAERFWDESQGYSEAARAVLAQPGGIAYAIFDDRIAAIARQFADFKDAEAQGAVRKGASVAELARALGLPPEKLERTIADLPKTGEDAFGRSFGGPPLAPPFYGVKVTGALFHTQGGLAVDPNARVLTTTGAPIANLFAVGGAACGVSGSGDAGYLSGNGLLSAVALGRIAGRAERSVWSAG